MEAQLSKLEREIEIIAVQQRDLAVQERKIGQEIQHSRTMLDQSTMQHKRANDEINRTALAGGTLTVDMLTARNALENKRNGFETTYNEATTALSKCHEALQAATEARSSKIEEARGLREAIRREAERIEKERQDALKKKREEEAEKKRREEEQKQRQEALEKKRKEEDEERKRIAQEKKENEENERKEREAKRAEAERIMNEQAALAQAQDEQEAMEAAKLIQGPVGPVEQRSFVREFFGAAQIIGDDIDALFGDDNAEQAAQSNALPMLAGMTGDLPPNAQLAPTAFNSADQQCSTNTAANPPVVSSAEPQEGGNGAAVTSTTPLEQQQPEGSQLQETENAAPPTASSVAEQQQRSATLAQLHATNNGPPSSSSAPLTANQSRKRIVETQLPASNKRIKRSGIDFDDLMALQQEEQIDWLAAFLRQNSRVITNSFVMTAWAMESIHNDGLQLPVPAPTQHTQHSGSDQDIVLVLDSDQDEEFSPTPTPTHSRAPTVSPSPSTREALATQRTAREQPGPPAAATAGTSHRSGRVVGIGPIVQLPVQQRQPAIQRQQQQRHTPQRQRAPQQQQQRAQEQQEQDGPRLIKQYSIAKLVTRGLSERQAEYYRSMPMITERVCPICKAPKEMSWANIAQHALACAVIKEHSSQRVPWTVEMKDLYIERSNKNDDHKSKKVNVGARRRGR